MGGIIALFDGTSTQINCIGSMNLCAKFHVVSTICKILLNIYTIYLHYNYKTLIIGEACAVIPSCSLYTLIASTQAALMKSFDV